MNTSHFFARAKKMKIHLCLGNQWADSKVYAAVKTTLFLGGAISPYRGH